MIETLLLSVLLAQNPNPPGHTASHPNHRHYKGGEVHEFETDGVTDGIVIWKNGDQQEMHNGVLGKWIPRKFKAREGKVKFADGNQFAVLSEPMVQADLNTAIIDKYVFVSPQQVTAWGGMSSAINKVNLAIDATNEAFGHSNVNAQHRLVGVAQYDQAEASTVDANLNAIEARYRAGDFDAIRASTGWDTLTLIVKVGDVLGEAFMMAFGYPMSVVNGDAATGNMTYAHENGHNMGLCHNYGDANCTPAPPCGLTGVGYADVASPSKFRTIMSYPGGPRTRQWSEPPPVVWYGDGVSAVGTVQTNAAGCLRQTVATVAAYHAQVLPIDTHTYPTNLLWTPPVHTAPTGLSWTPQ